jgi:hypothetical protein
VSYTCDRRRRGEQRSCFGDALPESTPKFRRDAVMLSIRSREPPPSCSSIIHASLPSAVERRYASLAASPLTVVAAARSKASNAAFWSWQGFSVTSVNRPQLSNRSAEQPVALPSLVPGVGKRTADATCAPATAWLDDRS